MYQYDTYDRQFVQDRVADFRDQTARYLAGQLDEEAFKPLRLMNGLYIQRHAPMLRVAIPYGVLSSRQLRMLASIATRYDRGYGHFTTRQNIQFNWPALERVPDILADLASVDMHAIQTSGNCIRNITCDHLAGVAPDEVADPPPVLRAAAPVVDPAPRVRLPAPEVQDRGHRCPPRPGRHRGARYRPPAHRGRRRAARLRGAGRRRDGAHPGHRQGAQGVSSAPASSLLRPGDHAGLQPGRAPGQQVQGPHQDPGQRAGRRRVSPARGGRVAGDQAARRSARCAGNRRCALALRVPALPADRRHRHREIRGRRGDARSLREMGAFRHHRPPPARLSRGIRLPQGARRPSRRHDGRADARTGGFGGSLQLRPDTDQPRSESAARRRRGRRSPRALAASGGSWPGDPEHRHPHQHDLLPGAGVLQSRQRRVHLHRAPDQRALRRSGLLARSRRRAHQDLRMHERLRPSPRGAHRHPGRRQEGEEWYQITIGGSAEERTRLGRRLGPAVPKAEVATTIAAILDVYVDRRLTDESFPDAVERIGVAPFQEQVYGGDRP